MNPIASIVCEYNIYQNASELEDVKNPNQDPLDGLGVCNEGKFQKLDRVVFADPIKFTDNDLNSENDAKSDQKFTFFDKVTVEKRLGKRNKYHIELADTTNPVCPECFHNEGKFHKKKVNCNKKFSTMTLLKAHIRKVHCAAQSYMCELCGASFEAQYLLTRHMTAHQRQKVECPVCKRLLSKRTSLSVHMRFVHRKGDLKCDKCDQRFEKRNQYVRHKKSHKT